MNKIIVPVSGGKDSTACLIMALKKTDDVVAVFNDTGWEHPVTYEYIDYLRETLKIEIHVTHGHDTSKTAYKGTTVPDIIRSVGRFPFGRGRFCTTYLKQRALKDWYEKNLYSSADVYEVWFGIRRDESSQRNRKYEIATPDGLYDMDVFYRGTYNKKLKKTLLVRVPIIDWLTKDVFKYLEDNGIKKNPLYDEGTNDRVGCYPCLISGKKTQEKIFRTKVGKERLEVIKQLEEELGIKYEYYDTSRSDEQFDLFKDQEEQE